MPNKKKDPEVTWKKYANGVWYPKYRKSKRKRFFPGNPGTKR